MSYDVGLRMVEYTTVDFEPHELRKVALVVAGAVAVADEPTPDEVIELTTLLDMLGIGVIK